jgi:hypothetical protein
MNSQSALKLINSIDQTITEVDSLTNVNPLIDSYFAKFLVVYICGVYEQTIENILAEFTAANSSRPEITNYVEKTLHRYFRNPDFSNLIKLIGTFSDTWKDEINKLTSQGLALDSIVNNKNALAHGQSITITLNDIKQYYKESRLIIDTIDSFAF